MRLDQFSNSNFDRGASRFKEAIWLVANGLLLSSWIPGSSWRCALMRAFGATVGNGVVIKPRLRVKFPWRLKIGDHVWIGEDVWIDNLDVVSIGSHSCISQGAYLCTGSHDWTDEHFGLITKPITVQEGCWVGAKACLTPGTIMESGAVLAMVSLGHGHLDGNKVFRGSAKDSSEFRKKDER